MTTTDERLERYLHDRSATIELPHAGVEAITRRARRHRRRRTAACGGVAAVLLAGGVAVALVRPAPDEEVGSLGAAVVDSPLEWSVVPVRTGIGWGSSAISDGEAVYSLSTAPGPESEGTFGEPRRLYRSDDGTDWEVVDLPEGLHASGVAGTDGSIYAVGTAAAGGEAAGVELAVSGDGGVGWDTRTVPVDLEALAEGFPGRVRAVDAEVAVSGATTVVAVAIAGTVDPAALLPADADPDLWYQQVGGLARPTGVCASTDPGASTTAPVTTTAPPTTAPSTTAPSGEAPPAAAGVDPSGRGAEGCADGAVDMEMLTWAELGLTPEQAALAEGQTHLLVGGPDGAVEPVEVIERTTYADATTSSLVAGDGGWWLLEDQVSARDEAGFDVSTDIVAWSSPDGRSWTMETLAADQATLAAGVVDGRPVVVGIDQTPGEEQRVVVHRVEGPGSATATDLNELLDVPAGAGVAGYAVGPLGVAVVLDDGIRGAEPARFEVVTSLDGLQWSRQPLPAPEPGTRDAVNGITVTPDAIKVRLNVRDEADLSGGAPAAQRLFVGTPAG